MIYKGTASNYDLTNKIASGGEGEIYEINGITEKVAKIYKPDHRTTELENKLSYMLKKKPNPETLKQLAWPLDIVYDNTGFAGFIMNKLNVKDNLEDISVYGDPYLAKITLKERLIIAQNICTVITDIHNLGYVFGDFNPRNIGINMSTGHVAFFDTDSYHVKTSNEVFRCKVACPEYVAPELLYKIDREGLKEDCYANVSLDSFTKQTDYFALAIHIFKLVNNGCSPFCGVSKDSSQITAAIATSVASPGLGAKAIKNRNYCFANGKMPFAELILNKNEHPKTLSKYFDEVFDFSPNINYSNNTPSRPTAEEWRIVLDDYEKELTSRPCSNGHFYYKKLSKCPYCEADIRFNRKISQPVKVTPIKQKSFSISQPTPMPLITPQTQPIPSRIHPNNSLFSGFKLGFKLFAKMYKFLIFAILAIITILIISHINKNNIIAPWMYTSTKNKAVELYEQGDYDEAIVYAQKLDYSKDQELIYKCYQKMWNNSISTGVSFIVGIKEDGTVVAAGDNEYGQCDVSSWNNIIAVSAGAYHTVGLKADGTVVAVGNNEDGQCQVYQWNNIVAISAGDNHTVGLKADGTVVACGGNRHGQCDVSDWSDIIAVSAGDEKTMGLKADGTVEAIGINDYNEQSKISTWTDIVQISAGGEDTIGLKSNGRVVAAGYNSSGACNIESWNDIIAIDCGNQRTIGIKTDGSVLLVGGYDDDNFLGMNMPRTKTEEVFYGKVAAVGVSNNHIILKQNGTIYSPMTEYISDSDPNEKAYNASEWTNIKTRFDNHIESNSATLETTVAAMTTTGITTTALETTATTTIVATTTTTPAKTTMATMTTTATEPEKVKADYLFVTPDPEKILLMSGNFNGKYVTGNGRYTTTKSGYYGFEITTEHPDSLPSLSIKDTYSSTKTKGYLSLDNQQEYEFVLFEKETGKIDFEDLTYGYKVMMYIPNNSFEIDGSFTANVFHNAQKQVYYFKPEVTGTYCFEIECSDGVNIEFDIREKHAEYAEKNIDINDYKKTDITLDAGTTYEITVYSRSKTQGSYTVLIS